MKVGRDIAWRDAACADQPAIDFGTTQLVKVQHAVGQSGYLLGSLNMLYSATWRDENLNQFLELKARQALEMMMYAGQVKSDRAYQVALYWC